ncbi:MAG: 30S ribosome-binding factor RbfA [Planctomycetes bacterium]|nr:30S ribosome-binding factor RbfA [Planctomycetota bacterium]
MTRRRDRIASLMRQTLGEILLSKLSDPRVDSARTSITSIEVAEDLLSAKVYVSVLGSEAEQRKTLRALSRAGGYLQELMMEQIRLRNTPILKFVADRQFKKTMETYQIIDQAMDEIRCREEHKQERTTVVQDSKPEAGDSPEMTE